MGLNTPLRWDQIGASFAGTTASNRNALQGLSSAGTIFGELRKSILEEEQKRVDNLFKEKDYEEKVRQFEKSLALNENIVAENARHQQTTDFYRSLDEGRKAEEHAVKRDAWNKQKEYQKAIEELTRYYTADRSGDESEPDGQPRTELSATEIADAINRHLLQQGFPVGLPDNHPIAQAAALERQRYEAAKAATEQAEHERQQSLQRAYKRLADTSGGHVFWKSRKAAAIKAMNQALQKYPHLDPELIVETILAYSSDSKKISRVGELKHLNLDDPYQPLAQTFALMAKNPELFKEGKLKDPPEGNDYEDYGDDTPNFSDQLRQLVQDSRAKHQLQQSLLNDNKNAEAAAALLKLLTEDTLDKKLGYPHNDTPGLSPKRLDLEWLLQRY